MNLSTKGLEQSGEVTPLVAEFLRQQNEGRMITIPVPKSLNNPLGVSVWHLMTTFKEQTYDYVEKMYEVEEKEKDPNDAVIYEIEDLQKDTGFIRQKGENVECKEDGELGDSYVNCLKGKDDVGPATHMLSYSWGNKISHIISSLFSYCCTNDLNPKRTYIWICCLCINQHRVKEMMERGEDVPFEDFGRVFEERVVKIGNVLALMVPWKKPIYLTRVWCIYETYTALIKNCILSIIMPEEEKENLISTIKQRDGADILYDVLASTRIENATASVPTDKEKILKLIESGVGYTEVNNKVNARLRKWIDETMVEMVKKAEDNSNDIATDEDLGILYNNIGHVYKDNGKYDAALECYKKSSVIFENIYGEGHPITAPFDDSIGGAYFSKYEYDDALEHFKKALSIYKKTIWIGEDHRNTANTYDQIGMCYMRKKEFKTALENLESSLSINKKIHGETHESTATTLNNIALCYSEKGEKDVALQKFFECLRISKNVIHEGHPRIAMTYYNIGLVYCDMNNLTDAEKYTKMAIDIREKVLGPDHPDTLDSKRLYNAILDNIATTYNETGSCYRKKEEFKTALENYDKSLSIIKKIHGEMHQSTAALLNNIALCYDEKGEKDVALQKYFECLRIKKNVLDEGHPDIASTYYSIGGLYYDMNNLTDAEKYTKMAINIQVKVLGPDHPDTLDSKGSYEDILAELEYYDVEKEESRKKLLSYTKDSLWGNTFCHDYSVGVVSYHFLNPSESISNNNSVTKFEAYISYEHPKARYKFDDGSPVPRKVPFQNSQWDTVNNTFRGSVHWLKEYETTLYGDRKWEYEMNFDTSFTCIVSGTWSFFGEDDVPIKVISFGTDGLYINSRVKDWYDSVSLLPSFCISTYFSQEGIIDKPKLRNMLEEVLFKNKRIRY